MTYTKTVPNYALYGDQVAPAWLNSFNFEWIPQRSAPYHWEIQPHRHEAFLQVLYLSAGQVVFQLDDTLNTLQAPCLLVIPAGHVHGFRFSTDTDGPVVTATQQALEALAHVLMPALLDTLRTPCAVRLQTEDPHATQLMPLFRAIEQESQTNAPGQVAAGMSLLIALFVQVRRLSGLAGDTSPAHGSRKTRQVERFRALVDQQFRTHRAVPRYASQLGVTAGQLTRLCREVLGLSSLDLINARMVHEAQRLLVYTGLPVKQLASELGFDDEAYFSRFFKKHTGLTPKGFRTRALWATQQGSSPTAPTLPHLGLAQNRESQGGQDDG